jgi:hypothetical protein
MPPGFYNPYDQQVYDAGFKFIPQSKFLVNPFQIPTDDSTTTPPNTGGITTLPRDRGDGSNPYNTDMSTIRQDYNAFPSRQAGEIYSKTFNPQSTFDPNLLRAQNTANLIRTYESGTGPGIMRLGNTVLDASKFSPGQRASMLKSADNFIDDARMQYATEGQFVDPYDPNYSSMTEAQKFMDNYPDYYGVPSGVPEPGIPGAIKSYLQNSLIGKGFGMAKDFLGRVLPINERAIMENEARGAGIFTDDIGRIVTDDYNTAGGIMAGYNLNKIDASTFDKRRGTIENTLGDKYGLSDAQIEAAINDPNYTGPGASLVERLGLLDEAEEDILGARKKTQQIYKMRADKKAADKKRKEAEAAAAAAAAAKADADRRADIQRIQSSLDSGGYDSTSSRPDRDRGSVTTASAAASKGVGGGGYTASDSVRDSYRGRYIDGGRVYYMDGGLADMLEIYD